MTHRTYARVLRDDPNPPPQSAGSAPVSENTAPEQFWHTTASPIWRPTDNLLLNFCYLRYAFDSSNRRGSDQVELVATYSLSDGSAWALRARRNSQPLGGRGNDSLMLSYAIPLGVPVSRKQSVGAVRGRAYDAQDRDTPGIPNVILTADGATAVTDHGGRFIFPALPPGTHAVRVDRGSIGLNRVTTTRTPLLVEVRAGEIREVDIGVVEAAQLSGTVVVMPSNGNGTGDGQTLDDGGDACVVGDPVHGETSTKPRGLGNVLVELANGDEVMRTVTNHRGQFLFEALRPGKWRLKVYDHNLPAFHYLESSETDLELDPG